MSTLNRCFLVLGLGTGLFLCGLTAASMADDVKPATPTPAAAQPAATQPARLAADNETVDQLIEQLDAAEFSKREAASAKLVAKGKDAVPALEKAAVKGNLEVSSRAMLALGKLLKSSDEKTENAARTALERISGGDVPNAARTAKSMLKKEESPSDQNQNNNNPFQGLGRIQLNGGMLQLGGGAGMKTMSISNVNGVRKIEASEGSKKVKIEDDPANGIKVEVTDKEDGKEVTKKYEAKDVKDLEKNHPSGYKVYKEYAKDNAVGGMGAIQLNIQGLQMPAMPAMPAIPLQPAQPIIPQAIPDLGNHQLDGATILLKTLNQRLEALQKAETLKNASDESKAELKKEIEELSKRLDEVKKSLGEK